MEDFLQNLSQIGCLIPGYDLTSKELQSSIKIKESLFIVSQMYSLVVLRCLWVCEACHVLEGLDNIM